MTGPYPSAETAAHMIAEEISDRRKRLEYAGDAQDSEGLKGMISGLEFAAWLLNIEDIVNAKLREAS